MPSWRCAATYRNKQIKEEQILKVSWVRMGNCVHLCWVWCLWEGLIKGYSVWSVLCIIHLRKPLSPTYPIPPQKNIFPIFFIFTTLVIPKPATLFTTPLPHPHSPNEVNSFWQIYHDSPNGQLLLPISLLFLVFLANDPNLTSYPYF